MANQECPACGGKMEKTWMAGQDRFFSETWECDCGFAVGARALDDPELRKRALERFHQPGEIKLPSPTSTPRPKPARANSGQPRCRHCGRELVVKSRHPEDRFLDRVETCDCSRGSSSPPPEPKKPKLAKPKVSKVPPSVPYTGSPTLWCTSGYLVKVRPAVFEGHLGLPRVWGDSEIRGGRKEEQFPFDELPRGFHLAMGYRFLPSAYVQELRFELIDLYNRLLDKQPQSLFDAAAAPSGVRAHFLALVAHYNSFVEARSALEQSPFAYLSEEEHSTKVSDYAFLQPLTRVCMHTFLPSEAGVLTPWDVGLGGAEVLQGVEVEGWERDALQSFAGLTDSSTAD